MCLTKNGIILICLFITSLPPLFFIIHEKNKENQHHDEWLLIKNKLNCSIIKKNMNTHEVYWKCNDEIIYVNNYEN